MKTLDAITKRKFLHDYADEVGSTQTVYLSSSVVVAYCWHRCREFPVRGKVVFCQLWIEMLSAGDFVPGTDQH